MRWTTTKPLALLPLGLAFIVGPVNGQVVEVPPFTVATPSAGLAIEDGDLAVAPDGDLAFLWVEKLPSGHTASSKAFVRRASLPGPSFGAIRRVDSSGWVEDEVSPSISRFGSGGYVAAWNTFAFEGSGYGFALFGTLLDGDAAPLGHAFAVAPTRASSDLDPAHGQVVAGPPWGALFVWIEGNHRLLAQRFDTTRRPLGNPIAIATLDVSLPQHLAVDVTRDGGFVVFWSDSSGPGQSWARAFAADGQPAGPPIPVGPRTTQALAANPLGGFAVAGTTSGLFVRRFDAAGALVGEDVIDVGNPSSVRADLAYDEAANLMVVWSTRESTPQGVAPPTGRYRAWDASGVPLGPPADIDPGGSVSRPRVAPMSGGRFVIGWSATSAFRASVVSLCAAGASVCGDGVLLSQCESCDDGSGNSDVLADACRTDCRRPHCGDGVLDSGEECDDGNTGNGDCCSWTCRNEPDYDGDGACDDDCRVFLPDFDQDGVCDPTDDCRLFPDPDQTGAAICAAAPLATLSAEQARWFEEGLEEFATIETPESGLGPVFNATSCAECHHQPTIGGSSARFVTRIGRDGPGGTFDPMSELGGSLVQTNGITTAVCSVDGELVPPGATHLGERNTPALFGLGLVDAIAEKQILRLSDPTDRNRDGISGRPNVIDGRIGRFGWKAQVASLNEFAALAYHDEMGVTSPGLPDDVAPQGVPSPCDPVADPEDDGMAVEAFFGFMRLLAPLPTTAPTPEARAGRKAFRRARCHKCHTDKLRTDFQEVRLRGKRVRLFSDLLLHDMGPGLSDGIVQGDASGSEFRTAPLWGVNASAPYLHDGRAPTLDAAITAHDGEAADSRNRYLVLTPEQRAALLAYLKTL